MSRAGPAVLAARLCEALHGEEAPVVEALLEQGADPNFVLPEGIAAIHLAAGKERESGVRCLKLILQYGGNPNARSVEELTPLHVAASWGCYKCLKLLLRNGGDPDLEDQDGNRAIDLALEQGNTMCVQILQGFQSACPPEEADGAHKHIFCHEDLRNAESFLSILTDDSTETGISSRLSEAWDDPGLLSSTQKCLPAGRPSSAGLGVTFNNVAAADACGRLSCIPGNLQNHPRCSVPPSHFHPGRSQGPATVSNKGPSSRPGPPQPVLSSTWLSASNDPGELTSRLTTTQGLPGDEASASPSSETDDSLTPPGPGWEDPTDSGHGLASQPVLCQDKSTSKEPAIFPHPQHCSMSQAARAQRSVSFCESPKIFPLHNNGNLKESPAGPRCSPRASDATSTLGLSQLSDFLDLEMFGKVNGREGLDVTSPDHVYLFCRANSTAIYDLEKTVMDPKFLARTHENSDPSFATGQVLRSSESGSSQYGSCDSDRYVSVADASDHSELKKCLEGRDGCTGGDTQRCSSSLCAGDGSADSNNAGSKDGGSQAVLGKWLMASTSGQSCEKLVEMPSAVEEIVWHVTPSRDTQVAGGRLLYASSEASHINRDVSGLTSAGKPASELYICGTAHESLKDTGVSSPHQELQAECVSYKQNDRGSNIWLTQEPHESSPVDDAVEETGPQEAATSVNNGQIIAAWELQGKLKGMLLSADGSPSARMELTSSQGVARKADSPSANGFDPETPDTVLLGGTPDTVLLGGTPDTVLLGGTPDTGTAGRDMEDNREEELNSIPLSGRLVLPPSLSSEADTLVIQRLASPADSSGEDENETQTLFPTKSFHSPLLQMHPWPCHVTPRTKSRLTSATRDSSSSLSLFEETLEMPRRPRRIRSPQGMSWMPVGPASCLEGSIVEGSWVAQGGENASCWEAEERNDLDDTEIIAKATSRSGSSAGHSSYPDASPMVLLDSDGGTDEQSLSDNKREAETGAACHPGLPPHLPSSDTDHPPSDSMWLTEDGEGDCTDPTRQVALTTPLGARAFSQAELDAANAERGRVLPITCLQEERRQHPLDAKRPPGPSRVSFSRLSSRRPSRATSATDHLSGRLSPVSDSCSQDIPLSPGGRPVNLSIPEPVEYLYMDEEEGYALIERHIPCTDDASVVADSTSSDDTIVYDWRAYQSKLESKENQPPQRKSPMATSKLHLLSDEALLRKLRNRGANPGPITGLTRKLYVQLLDKLMKDPNAQARKKSPGHSPELASALETFQIPDGKDDDMALSRQFDQPDKSRKWREGLLKSSFNYLLLDPRVTQNLPFRCHHLSQADCFRTFISAIFYVGKGKRSRPYSHLYQALTHYKGGKKQACPKVQHILDIWAGGQGVISVHCFQNVIPVEAYTREACLVEAIGLKMLTNQKKGNYYGVVASWPMKRCRCLGIHMLHRAMQIFLAEGERQLRPADIQIGQ